MECSRSRPPEHADCIAAAGAKHIQETAAAGVHDPVSEEEEELKPRVLRVGNRDCFRDLSGRDGETLAVEVAETGCDGEESGHSPSRGVRERLHLDRFI